MITNLTGELQTSLPVSAVLAGLMSPAAYADVLFAFPVPTDARFTMRLLGS